MKILLDNGTEFKNQFTDVTTQLGVEHKESIPLLIIPNPMEELKGFIISSMHACLNIYPSLLSGPSDSISLCCTNFLPIEQSKEIPFFLMFGSEQLDI